MSQHQRRFSRTSDIAEWEEVPLVAGFQDQTLETYAVRDLHYGDIIAVPKARAVVESFPPTPEQPLRGVRVARWSGYALVLALLGGLGGMILGALVVLAALAGLARFGARARRWQRAHRGALLPAGARGEYDRLRAALGQGLLALAIGTIIAAFFWDIVR